MNVGDVRKTRDDARAVGVAQAALHVELVVARGFDGVDRLEVLVQSDLAFSCHGASFLPRERGPSSEIPCCTR